jgi:hypothetical protein
MAAALSAQTSKTNVEPDWLIEAARVEKEVLAARAELRRLEVANPDYDVDGRLLQHARAVDDVARAEAKLHEGQEKWDSLVRDGSFAGAAIQSVALHLLEIRVAGAHLSLRTAECNYQKALALPEATRQGVRRAIADLRQQAESNEALGRLYRSMAAQAEQLAEAAGFLNELAPLVHKEEKRK